MTDTKPCHWCDGSGKRANTPDREPWTVWMNLPLKSAMAVTMGLVRPVECDECNGTGQQPLCASTAGDGAHQCKMLPGHEGVLHKADDGHFWSDSMSDQAIAKMAPESQALAWGLVKITDGPPHNPHNLSPADRVRQEINNRHMRASQPVLRDVDWSALLAVLDLQMPTWDRDPDEDDSDYRAGMTDGWTTCHGAAIQAIGAALGVNTHG